MRLRLYFIIANILLMALAAATFLPDRLSYLQGQEAAISLRERQLAILEENYRMYEENTELLASMRLERLIIQQPGYMGALLTDIRSLLHNHNLAELEFHASEQAQHYLIDHLISETRTSILAEGQYNNISSFITALTEHQSYIRPERIQISMETEPPRLWLTLSIYEKQ